MRSGRQKGFTLFMVVIFMALLGLILAVLSNNMKNIAYETTTDRLMVFHGVLESSSLAWAKQNRLELVNKGVGGTVELDVSGFGINGALSSIEVIGINDGVMKIEIKAVCSRGRVMFDKTTQASLKVELQADVIDQS